MNRGHLTFINVKGLSHHLAAAYSSSVSAVSMSAAAAYSLTVSAVSMSVQCPCTICLLQ